MKQFRKWAFSLPLSLLIAAAGCSDEDLDSGQGNGGQGDLHEVEITFNIGTRDGLHTRATNGTWDDCLFIPDGNLIPQSEPPRELISSNNWQQVNDVRIYVFKENGQGEFVYYCPETKDGNKQNYFSVDAFSDKFESSPYAVWWGGKDDLNEAHSYTIKPMLPAGKYHFLAVARDDKLLSDDDKSLTDPNTSDDEMTYIDAWIEGITVLEKATLIGTKATVINATELFSGCTAQPVTVIESGGFQKEIALYRAEAGLMAYIENIPAKLEAWQTYSGGRDGNIDKGEFYNVYSIGVTNGDVLSDRVLLYDREAIQGSLPQKGQDKELLNRFLYLEDLDQYETTGSGNNVTYVNTSPDNKQHPNSLLLGGFIMPQKSNTKGNDEDDKDFDKLYKSLYLVFYTMDETKLGEVPLQWWPIKLVSSTPVTGETAAPDPYYFPIKANQFYSLGKRKFTDDGSELVEDEPIDLKKEGGEESNLVITVNPDWDWKGELEWAD